MISSARSPDISWPDSIGGVSNSSARKVQQSAVGPKNLTIFCFTVGKSISKNFSLCQYNQTSSGAHPASYPKGTRQVGYSVGACQG